MTTPTSRGAYGPYFDALDKALEEKTGIRIKCQTQGDANQYRVRLHTARTLDRQLNRESREISDPYYGTSDYDKLIVRVRPNGDGTWWVYIQRNAIVGEIEVLPEWYGIPAPRLISPLAPSPASSAEKPATPKLPPGRRLLITSKT